MARYYEQPSHPWYKPRYWRRRVWVGLAIVTVIVIVVAVVAGVLVSKQNQVNNSYPDYTKLNYRLSGSYAPESFFDNFNYFTGYDPAGGLVHYVPKETAQQLNLTYTTSTSAVLRVDDTVGPNSKPDASTGRFSVRIESKTQYSQGLYLFDIKHAPVGCGTWPALWMADPNNNTWPRNGEIDVMETVNNANTGNTISLHTSAGCDMSSIRRNMTGVPVSGAADCDVAKNGNSGCGVNAAGLSSGFNTSSSSSASSPTSGAAFNAAGGGVVALEWRNEGIRMWQFAQGALPADVLSTSTSSPDPSSWGVPTADFPNTACNVASHFKNQTIIVDIDICGLAENDWKNSGCSSTCPKWIAENPTAFKNAYWEFGAFRMYTAS